MPREIRVDQIGGFLKKQVGQLVKASTLEWEARVKQETPVDTGNLRNGWRSELKGFSGVVENRVEYAEPVCYGTSLPPSWKDESGKPEYKTKQGTVPGFPDRIAKELEPWIKAEYERIKRQG